MLQVGTNPVMPNPIDNVWQQRENVVREQKSLTFIETSSQLVDPMLLKDASKLLSSAALLGVAKARHRQRPDTYSATHTAAMPMPVPTHMLLTPTRFPVRRNSYSSVLT